MTAEAPAAAALQDTLRRFVESLDCECDPAYSTIQCGRCAALAASAQVREVEPEQLTHTQRMFLLGAMPPKPAAEPVPVAQDWPYTFLNTGGVEYVPKRHANERIANLTQQLATSERERDALRELAAKWYRYASAADMSREWEADRANAKYECADELTAAIAQGKEKQG